MPPPPVAAMSPADSGAPQSMMSRVGEARSASGQMGEDAQGALLDALGKLGTQALVVGQAAKAVKPELLGYVAQLLKILEAMQEQVQQLQEQQQAGAQPPQPPGAPMPTDA